MQEIWKDIEWYEGLYQISNLGRVKSLDRFVKNWYKSWYYKKWKILSKWYDKNWYKKVCLCCIWDKKYLKVHRLVAITFISNPDNFPIVMHLNNDPGNNNYWNLKWWSSKENTQQMWDEWRHSRNYGSKRNHQTTPE